MFDDSGNLLPENEAVFGVIKASRGMHAGLKTNREEGIEMLEKSFSSNPELLKKFAGEYFYNLNRAKGPDAKDIITGRLAELEEMNDNSEDVLVTLTRWFDQVGDTVKSGEYEKALVELDKFIAEYKSEKRGVVKDAFLMKGKVYIQLGKIEKAVDEFLTVSLEYPETEQAPEASFFIGYCRMLEGKFGQAKEAFTLVVTQYPQSSYSNKAKLCLERIDSTTE